MNTRLVASVALTCALAACTETESPTGPKVPSRSTVAAAIGTDPVTGASIETNQDDYLPGEFVHVVGKGWAPNENVHLFMTESPDTHEDVAMDVTADSTGAFSVHFYDVQQYDLGVTFTMTASGLTSASRATAVFTDGRAIASVTFNGSATVTVAPSTVLTVLVTGALTGNNNNTLGSLGVRIYADGSASSTGVLTCFDVNPDDGPASPSQSVPFSHSIAVTAPATPGQYDVDATSFEDDACSSSQGANTLTKDKAITIASANAAPTLGPIGNKSVNEGTALTFTATATDTDTPAQTLTYSLVGAPAGATINPSSGAFSWTPTDGPAQNATFTVKVTDNGSPAMSDEEEISVTVANVAPTATFTAPTPVTGGQNIELSLTDPADASSVDQTTGFTYAFDCGSGYGAFTATSTASCTTSGGSGSRTVKGQIKDKDNGVTEYTATVAIDNAAPIANAGGEYSGNEGSAIAITGTGSDPDGGAVTYLWTAPDACVFGNATSAGTTVTCNDNGAYDLTLTVTDDEGASTPSATKINVSNVAPTATFNAPSPVNEGSNIMLSLTGATDPSSADGTAGFTYQFDCGAGYGAATSSASTTCSTNDNGSRSVKGKIIDKDNGATEYSASVTITNVAPTATFNAPSSVNEGSDISLSLSSPADPSTVDVAAGFQFAFDCGDGLGYAAYTTTATRTCPTTDDAIRSVHGKVKDKDGGETAYSYSVTVNNVAPDIAQPISVPSAPVAVGSPVAVSWTFTDPGTDTWQCKISWTSPVAFGPAFASSGKTCSFSTTALPAGVYTVTVDVTDDDGGSDQATATTYVVVYDPNGGFVTGGGWVDSPLGAYVAAPTLSGKATFGFVSKYKKGQSIPDGSTEFQFHAASMNFKSGTYEWLVVSGAKAQFKGTGTINGSGNYGFLLTAIDGQVNGGGGTDKFRIKIWDKNNGDAVVYDNNMSATDTSDPTTLLGGGSINIQAK